LSSRVLSIGLAICLALSFAPRLQATAAPLLSHERQKQEAHERLKAIERNKQEVHQKLHEARKKAEAAESVLHEIKSKLNATQTQLTHSQKDLKKTQNKIQECATKLVQTKSQQELMEDEAGRRLREIYEGERIGLVEMIFEVTSLQTLLDLFYYQQRIADADRQMLEQLRANAAALAAKKNQLGSKKTILGDLITQIALKAMELTKKKDTQEQIADRLRSDVKFYEEAERQLAIESHQLEHQIVDMCDKGGGTAGSGTFSMPLHAAITSPFGWRTHPIFGVKKFHTGIDIAGPNHSEIRAADSGTVVFTGVYGGYGRVVILSHGKGMATLYAHMSRAAVSQGANVHKGEIIGYEGTTGFSTGPHLHFEVRKDGKPNNPLNYVH